MKRITVSTAHFEQAKKQAYVVREQLSEHLSLGFDELKKTEFLSLWVSAIGYRDWGEFQSITNHANVQCTNTLIITPISMPVLVDFFSRFARLSSESVIEYALLKACTAEELKLFDVSPADFTESDTITLALMPNGHIKRLTDKLWWRHNGYSLNVDRLKTDVLAETKRERKVDELTKLQAMESYADFYPNSGTKFETILNQAIDSNYLRRYRCLTNDEDVVELTDYARSCYFIEKTRDGSPEYIKWMSAIFKVIDTLKVRNLPLSNFADSFHEGVSSDDFIKDIVNHPHHAVERTNDTRLRIEQDTGTSLESNSTFLCLNPRFFMPASWQPFKLKNAQLELRLEQDGANIELPKDIVLGKPYPNQRYIVAGPAKSRGFFITLSSRAPLTLHLKWHFDIDGGFDVNHTIRIELKDFCANNIFSMQSSMFKFHESCSPSSFMTARTIVPKMPEDTSMLYKDHYRFRFNHLEVNHQKRHMAISESVTLNALNVHDFHNW
ncbi:hypothetical protein [Moritella sp. F3]|uniref:hypothetical protein n=1 Tax=Moritella sp. F3 TaxID=2718882 RepID=UPI0018E1C3BE|nr:hypothetical protein [Moritella sp. F3]GIC77641.1 hypothetical protein FMO001_23680 [Moritella sp. F1]GIC82054.1 hypothetical protein FMO003_23350 [Moritella sp. F3]